VCGIIALMRGPGDRLALPIDDVLGRVEAVRGHLRDAHDLVAAAQAAAAELEALDQLLRTTDGVALLVRERDIATRVEAAGAAVAEWIQETEVALDAGGAAGGRSLEEVNATLLRLKDARWAVERDRVPTARRVRELVGADAAWSAIEIGTSIEQALSAIDRLEVRGRDSAGLMVLVRPWARSGRPCHRAHARRPGRRPAPAHQRGAHP